MADMARVRAITSGWSGGPGLTTVYFQNGAGTAFDDDSIGDCRVRVRNAFEAYKSLCPPSWSAQVEAEVAIMNPANGEIQSVASPFGTPAVTTGSGSEDYGPTLIMGLVRYNTGVFVNGRSIKGRTFLGPMQIHDTVGGQPDATMIAGCLAFGTALGDPGTTTPRQVVWHRPRTARAATVSPPHDAVAAAVGSMHMVLSWSVSPKFSILRSRRD